MRELERQGLAGKGTPTPSLTNNTTAASPHASTHPVDPSIAALGQCWDDMLYDINHITPVVYSL